MNKLLVSFKGFCAVKILWNIGEISHTSDCSLSHQQTKPTTVIFDAFGDLPFTDLRIISLPGSHIPACFPQVPQTPTAQKTTSLQVSTDERALVMRKEWQPPTRQLK